MLQTVTTTESSNSNSVMHNSVHTHLYNDMNVCLYIFSHYSLFMYLYINIRSSRNVIVYTQLP